MTIDGTKVSIDESNDSDFQSPTETQKPSVKQALPAVKSEQLEENKEEDIDYDPTKIEDYKPIESNS